ncbi:MAG: hypothetical protein KC535_01350 [Nanoarchaeota archaeon]|nr:hypothetical protein [Nanoarchaeota archaeon]
MRKGQSAVEFVVLVSFMIVVFFLFFIIIQGRIIDLSHRQDLLYLKEANNIVLSEVDLAFSAAPDFEHTFVVPDRGAEPFLINISDNREVVSSFGDQEYVNFFPFNVTGHLFGLRVNNTVYSTDGIIIFPDKSQQIVSSYAGISMNVNPESCYIADTLGDCANTSLVPAAMRPLCNQYYGLC